MSIVCLHDREEIERFARRNSLLHVYEIGDLDDTFWPHTLWFALRQGEGLKQLALLFTDLAMPVLLANAEPPADTMTDLLRGLLPLLPQRFYAHLPRASAPALEGHYRLEDHGAFWKMGLLDPARALAADASSAAALTLADVPALLDLYRASYPGHWFTPRMLEVGHYVGVRAGARIVSVAGTHVYSPRYRVASLGNITTHPDHRGRGLGTAVTAGLCRTLLADGIEHIGLNVRADNAPAVACYQGLGFSPLAEYGEYTLERKA